MVILQCFFLLGVIGAAFFGIPFLLGSPIIIDPWFLFVIGISVMIVITIALKSIGVDKNITNPKFDEAIIKKYSAPLVMISRIAFVGLVIWTLYEFFKPSNV